MIDSLPLDLFDGDDRGDRPIDATDANRHCQWCAVSLPYDATFCTECGGRVAGDVTVQVPGLTELTPDQRRAERQSMRRPSAAHWSDADDPLAVVVALTAVEVAVETFKGWRSRRKNLSET